MFSDLFIKNHGLQDKIAESINKALHQDSNSLVNPETSHTTHSSEVQGELIPGTSTTTTSNGTHDETVRTILTETENDPAFADFLEEFIGIFIFFHYNNNIYMIYIYVCVFLN